MQIFAERHLQLRLASGTVAVSVALGHPVSDASGEDWQCQYQVCFGESCKTLQMYGADSMQALQLAMVTLDVELLVGARHRGGVLYHFDEPFTSILEGGNLRAVPCA